MNMMRKMNIGPAACQRLVGFLLAIQLVSCGQDPSARAAELLKEGLAAQSSGDLNLALLKYTEAIDLNPGLFAAYINRGNIKVQTGMLDGGRADYQRAAELDPEHIGVVYNLGLIEHLTSNFDAAMTAYNRAIALEPDNGQIYLNRSSLYYALGNRDAAIGDLQRVIDTNPDAYDAHLFRGNIYYDDGEFEQALAEYALAGEGVFVALRMWLTQSRLGRNAEANEKLKTYMDAESDPELKDLSRLLLEFCTGLISEDMMIGWLDHSGKRDDLAPVCFYIGSARLLTGDEAGAIAMFERGVEQPSPMQSEYLSMKAYLNAYASR